MRFGVILLLVIVGCGSPETPPATAAEGLPSGDDVETFLNSYFQTWSQGDMAAYRSHFSLEARIRFSRRGKVVKTYSLGPFIEEQIAVKSGRGASMVERMLSFETEREGDHTIATARWELKRPDQIKTGIDRFTLARDGDGRWRILDLLFYFTGPDGKPE